MRFNLKLQKWYYTLNDFRGNRKKTSTVKLEEDTRDRDQDQDVNQAEGLRLYRSLHVLSNLHNEVMAGVYMQGYQITVTAFLAFPAFISIRCSHSLPLSTFFLFPLLVTMTTFMIGTLTTILIQKYEKSVSVINVLSKRDKNSPGTGNKGNCLERELASLAPLKCWIGSVYFMSRSTTLVYLGFILNLVSSLLLTF